MKTDRHLYALFRACPEYLFLLAGLPSPGPCKMEQVTIKAISRTMDGLITPRNPAKPLTVVEFQFQREDGIYYRVVVEMVGVQRERKGRRVQGLILFRDRSCDPRTKPWTSVVQVVYLDEMLRELEARDATHPLVLVFKPLLERSEAVLEKQVATHYKRLRSRVPRRYFQTFEEVFVDWLMQRFKTRTPQEITAMFAELTPIEKTVCGKELIGIGLQRGLQRGRTAGRKDGQAELLRELIAVKFNGAAARDIGKLANLSSTQLRSLGIALLKMKRASELKTWLAVH